MLQFSSDDENEAEIPTEEVTGRPRRAAAKHARARLTAVLTEANQQVGKAPAHHVPQLAQCTMLAPALFRQAAGSWG